MNFRKKRYSNRKTGGHYRVYDISVINATNDVASEEVGMVFYSNAENTMFFVREATEFYEKFVEGWLTKEELGITEEEETTSETKVKPKKTTKSKLFKKAESTED